MQHHVLFIDDEEEVLHTLRRTFHDQDFAATYVDNGNAGLEILAKKNTSMIVTDMRMPKMNGIEFLGKAKQICPEAICIILSGYSDMDSVIQAINEHKIWYFINKPWNTLELQQIVKNGVELYESRFHERELNKQLAEKNALLNVSQKALVRANNDLENVVEQRTIELSKALERLEIIDKTKNDFFSLLSHELRTPLNGIIGIGLLAFDERPNSPQNEKLHGLFDKASERILTLIDDALFFGQLQENVNTPAVSSVPLKNIIGQAYEQVTEYAVQRGVEIIHDDVVEKNIRGDRDLLKKAFRSLMRIAINLCPKNKAVRINTQATVTGVDVHFVTDELSLKPDSIKSFFEVLGVNDIVTPDCNLGLDPVIAKRIVNMFGGTVHIENLSPAGICLKVMLAG